MAYRVINGFNYPDGKGGEVRVEAETVLERLPKEHAAAILKSGCVEEITEDFTTGPLEASEPEEDA